MKTLVYAAGAFFLIHSNLRLEGKSTAKCIMLRVMLMRSAITFFSRALLIFSSPLRIFIRELKVLWGVNLKIMSIQWLLDVKFFTIWKF
jgi:hypothetical protein